MALLAEPFDPADYLTDEETISFYLTEALEGNEPRLIAQVLDDVARARARMTEIPSRP